MKYKCTILMNNRSNTECELEMESPESFTKEYLNLSHLIIKGKNTMILNCIHISSIQIDEIPTKE